MNSIKCSILIFSFFMVGCEPSVSPGISLYKSRGDYFELVTVGFQNNKIIRTWGYNQSKYKFVISGRDTIFRYRIRMANGYVLDAEANYKTDAFINLTHKQYIIKESNYSDFSIPHDTLKKHIIDKNPYIEFYRDEANPKRFGFSEIEEIDTAEINRIIKENKIELYFNRIY